MKPAPLTDQVLATVDETAALPRGVGGAGPVLQSPGRAETGPRGRGGRALRLCGSADLHASAETVYAAIEGLDNDHDRHLSTPGCSSQQ